MLCVPPAQTPFARFLALIVGLPSAAAALTQAPEGIGRGFRDFVRVETTGGVGALLRYALGTIQVERDTASRSPPGA
jgi:hypothetical protein